VANYFQQMWGGPGHFRFMVQPAVAIALGLIDGLDDYRRGLPPYLWALLRDRPPRASELTALLRRLAVPLTIGIGLSAVSQLIIRGSVIWAAAVGFGVLFIAAPYVVARALVNRLVRWRRNRQLTA
jgi:hypothetical protein